MIDGSSGRQLLLLGLGTNLGCRQQNLRGAIIRLREFMMISAISPVYETEPWGIGDQPAFLNMCLAASSDIPPKPLLATIKALEVDLGRKPSERWGPRLIDIDILFYDNLVLDSGPLTLPHPQVAERGFVLAPLADIVPDYRHPESGKSVAEMLAEVDTSGVHRLAESLFSDGNGD